MVQRMLWLTATLLGCYAPDPTKIDLVMDSSTPDSAPQADLLATMQDAGPVSQCKVGGGIQLGVAWGCAGAFPAGGALGLCKAGCRLCTSQTGIAGCATAANYYAAEVSGYWFGTMSQETCGGSSVNQLLYGCGMGGRVSTKSCSQFPNVLDVGGASSLRSPDGTLSSASNSDPSHGVLCCCP